MAENKLFSVRMNFVFSGTVYVAASNADEAKEIAEKSCGLVMGEHVHRSSSNIVDWDFPNHPKKQIVSARFNLER